MKESKAKSSASASKNYQRSKSEGKGMDVDNMLGMMDAEILERVMSEKVKLEKILQRDFNALVDSTLSTMIARVKDLVVDGNNQDVSSANHFHTEDEIIPVLRDHVISFLRRRYVVIPKTA